MNSTTISKNKEIAKNTIYMYLRMFLVLLIGLYTSRVLLKILGVEDYGIYNVVGSVVVMFTSLRASVSAATIRFLNYEMGEKGDTANLAVVFRTSIRVNNIISIAFIILVEIIGLWFLNYKINISPDRLKAAHWVFQFSIISAVINILTTPYDAEIIAHERFGFYSIMSIIESILKLGIIFLLPIIPYDKFIIYGLLILTSSIVVRIINSIFCKINFKECQQKAKWTKEYFKKMITFSGWNILGNIAYFITDSGINMVINVFGGPIVNAARAIAYQVKSALLQMINNINVAILPYYTQTYASGEEEKSYRIMYFSSKVLFYVQLCIIIVLTYLLDYILHIWLIDVPKYANEFVFLICIFTLIRTLHSPIDNLFKAHGNLKYYQIIEGIILIIPLLVSYILLSLGFCFESVFISVIIFEFVNLICILLLANKQCKLNIKKYISNVFFPVIVLSVTYSIGYWITMSFYKDFMYSLMITIISLLLISIIFIVFSLNRNERNLVLKILKLKKIK